MIQFTAYQQLMSSSDYTRNSLVMHSNYVVHRNDFLLMIRSKLICCFYLQMLNFLCAKSIQTFFLFFFFLASLIFMCTKTGQDRVQSAQNRESFDKFLRQFAHQLNDAMDEDGFDFVLIRRRRVHRTTMYYYTHPVVLFLLLLFVLAIVDFHFT